MKKLFNFLKNHPIYCLIIVICVVFLPGAIIAKPQTESKLIIRALGIDKAGDEYQVSAIAFLPKASQSFQENYKIVEGKGRTLYDAVSAAAKETGKDIGLAHTGIVFVNDEICQEGLVESIDFLVRDYSLGNDTYVVYVPDSTKELVEAAHNLAMSSGIHLGDVAGYDERKVVHGESNIESIYDSAYSPSKCSLMTVMEMSEEEGIEPGGGQNTSGTGGEEQSGGGGGGASQSQKKILNEEKILILKEGKKALILEPEQTKKYKWTKSSNFADALTLENYSDKNFKNATLSLSVSSNNVSQRLSFKNGKPIFTFLIKPKLSIVEVNQDNLDDDIFIDVSKFETEKLKTTINNRIKNEVYDFIQTFVDANTDINMIYEKFNAEKTSQFQSFLEGLENKENFLSEIKFYVEVDCKIE